MNYIRKISILLKTAKPPLAKTRKWEVLYKVEWSCTEEKFTTLFVELIVFANIYVENYMQPSLLVV